MNENVKKRIVEEFYIPVENAQFSKKKRNGQWNGKLKIVKSVFDKESGYWETIIPKGLWYELYIVCKKYNFNIKFEVKVINDINFEKVKKYIDEKYNVQKYIKSDIRDFQYKCVYDLLKYNSICGEAVPASGKSLIIYLVCRLMLDKDYQSVIIVPNVGLCQQMYDDFKNYGFKNIAKNVQIINNEYKEKNFVKKIVISTWQSLQNK
jgi:primosomal protein N'